MSLVGQVNLDQARAPAELLLNSKEVAAVAAAVGVIGTEPQAAREFASRFLAGKFLNQVKPNVVADVQRHLPQDSTDELAQILTQLFRDGLQIMLGPKEVTRITSLVISTGDPERGRALYLSTEQNQCAKCHRLEGVGGEIGPDLTRIWKTLSVAKILESIVETSRKIKEGFIERTAETKKGQVYTGLKVSDTLTEIVRRDANGRKIRVTRDQLETIEETKQSLMPVGTVGQLSFSELVDLLAFLKSAWAQRVLRHQGPASGG